MLALVTIHGAREHPPTYAEGFARSLSEAAQTPVLLRPVWYGDLIQRRYRTPLILNIPAYIWALPRLRSRVREAFVDLDPAQTLLVTHSWGTVIACNLVPHDRVRTWVTFGSYPYFPLWFTPWPRVEEWHNFWSPTDVLSAPWEMACNHEIPSLRHTPMWADPHRAQWVANIWSKDG